MNLYCTKNEIHGIAASDPGTAPLLKANVCKDNEAWGITSWNNAMPKVEEGNTITGNKEGQ